MERLRDDNEKEEGADAQRGRMEQKREKPKLKGCDGSGYRQQKGIWFSQIYNPSLRGPERCLCRARLGEAIADDGDIHITKMVEWADAVY
jgi:hypothetical protein